MQDKFTRQILDKSRDSGWVLEPDAKALMKHQGLEIPHFILTDSVDAAEMFFDQVKGPVVAKAVSRNILHKTEQGAVVTGIASKEQLQGEMERLKTLEGCERILIEEMVSGIELMVGAKNDFQFGPVVLLGFGGTAVEVYKDTAVRMAPLEKGGVASMVDSLKTKDLILGHRGKQGVDINALSRMMDIFSSFAARFEPEIESIDLNPVICTKDKCIIADARMILTGK